MHRILRFAAGLLLLSFISLAQNQNDLSGEQLTAKRFEAARRNPQALRSFLYSFPKGGDLHMHLSGAVYAESYIGWAAASNLCVENQTLTYVPPAGGTAQCDSSHQRRALDALSDAVLYRRLIDAFSMRNFVPGRLSGAYQFFDSFGKFGAAASRTGDMVAEVAHRAAAQNQNYLEIMLGLDSGVSGQAAAAAGSMQGMSLEDYRRKLVENGIEKSLAAGRRTLDDAEARMRAVLNCDTPAADPGCKMTIRYIFSIGRAVSLERVFAQTLSAFMMSAGGTSQSDDRVVGLNYVQPEDSYLSLSDFAAQMEMLDWLHGQYPNVHLTLHAGELAFGQVDPNELGRHIRSSVEKAHAQRIGHGVDVMYDPDAQGLLQEMAARQIAVEICLSSNDQILGVRGKDHPFMHYLKAGVPLVIATDDQGVARSDITHEYQRAVEDFGISYADLKQIVRNSLEYSFLDGKGIWVGKPGKLRPECTDIHSRACAEFIKSTGHGKATAEVDLEMRFQAFQAKRWE